MKNYIALAGRYLKQQRRRTILTVVGIVLSVALISALGTMGQSMKDNIIDQTKSEDGSFHFGYGEATPELYSMLQNYALLDQVGAIRSGAATKLTNNFNVILNELTSPAFKLAPLHIQDGRLPQSGDEVALEEWVLAKLPNSPKLESKVELTRPDGTAHEYRIVGILRNQKYAMTSGKSTAVTVMDDPKAAVPETNLQIIATFKSGVDISSHLNDVSKLAKSFFPNATLLALMGESSDQNLNLALLIVFGVLIGLVVLSTVAVIYNAFNIAVLERMRHFGLLRTIGATPGQIRALVFREAATLAVLGIPLGLLIGYGGLWLVLKAMTSAGFHILTFEGFKLSPHFWIIGGSALVGFIAVLLAAWLPARKAGRVSPVDAVRGAGGIVRETYKRGRIPSLLNLFGVEGKMASKNIRRNRSKFRITAFSIVVSIMLFIVFHYFTQEAFKIVVNDSQDDQIAFQIRQNSSSFDAEGNRIVNKNTQDALTAEQMEQIKKLPGVAHVYGRYMVPNGKAMIPTAKLNSEFIKKVGTLGKKQLEGTEVQEIFTNTVLYDDERMAQAAKYLISGTADPKKLVSEGGVLIVQDVNAYIDSENKKVHLKLASYKVGDTLTINMGQGDKTVLRTFKISGILSQAPFSPTLMEQQLIVLGPKESIAKLVQGLPADQAPTGTKLTGIEVALADNAPEEPVRQALNAIVNQSPDLNLIDYAKEQKEGRQFNLQMQIFVYGFLAVIGLIGSLNIINTVQTNLMLRRREFGLLQAVGMTMRQLRGMATLEGLWFGVIGSFWGLLLGVGFSYLLFVQLNKVQGIQFAFPWTGAIISCVFALGVGLLSVQGPLRRIEKANIIEELREEV